MNDFLKAYHRECQKNNRPASGISPYATDLANVTSHHFTITWQDMGDLRQEVNRLKSKIHKLETRDAVE